jgi:hypothetical protein
MPPVIRALIVFLAVLSPNIAFAGEPSGLSMEFHTTNASSVFHIGEIIPIQVSFSSTASHRYLAPCNLFFHPGFGFPQCYFATPWRFTISPAEGWRDISRDLIPSFVSGPTFEVPTRNLARELVTQQETLSDLFRFSKPGEYNVRLTVEIALDDHKSRHKPGDPPKPKTVTVSRELLIHIVPVDVDWEAQVIRKGVEAFSARRQPEVDDAAKGLCYLGTPNAALALAHLAIQDRVGYGCIVRSPSVETAVEEMQRLLVDPEAPVSQRFFEQLVGLLNRAESPRHDMIMISPKIVDEQREVLFQALPRKQHGARIISLMTVLANPPRVLPIPTGIMHFQEPVIATLVSNWDDLPEDFKARLLKDLWPAIQSPLLLSILRSRAEAGDQIALQRWMEMDPAGAAEFLKHKNSIPKE